MMGVPDPRRVYPCYWTYEPFSLGTNMGEANTYSILPVFDYKSMIAMHPIVTKSVPSFFRL